MKKPFEKNVSNSLIKQYSKMSDEKLEQVESEVRADLMRLAWQLRVAAEQARLINIARKIKDVRSKIN